LPFPLTDPVFDNIGGVITGTLRNVFAPITFIHEANSNRHDIVFVTLLEERREYQLSLAIVRRSRPVMARSSHGP